MARNITGATAPMPNALSEAAQKLVREHSERIVPDLMRDRVAGIKDEIFDEFLKRLADEDLYNEIADRVQGRVKYFGGSAHVGRMDSSSIDFLQSGIATSGHRASRTVQAKVAEQWISVKDANNSSGSPVAGDGTTDDATGCQRVLDALDANGGGVMFIPPDTTCLIGTKLVGKSNVVVTGAGYASALAGAAGISTPLEFAGKSNFGVENIRLFGTGTASADLTYGVSVTDASTDGYVRNCDVDTCYLGIFVGNVSTTSSSRIAIEDNRIHTTGLNAIGVNCFGTNISIKRNYARAFGQLASVSVLAAGIEYRGATKGSISGNILQDGNYGGGVYNDGIRIEYANESPTSQPAYLTVEGNNIDTVSGHGIRLQQVQTSVVSGNVIRGHGGNGIYLISSAAAGKSTEDCTVANNVIDGGTSSINLEGGVAQPTRRNKITGNQCLNSSNNGLNLTLADDNEINGNSVYLCNASGIRQDSGNRNRIALNKALNCGTSGTPGIEIVGGADTRLVDNESIDTRGTALMTYGLRVYAGPTDTVIEGGKYTPALTGPMLDAGTRTLVKGYGGFQSVTFATAITPDPFLGETVEVGALTDNITINEPINPINGMKLAFEFQQDGTGGRTVTWNSKFKTTWSDTGNTLNTQAAAEFVYSKSQDRWRQVSGQKTWA